MTDSTRLTDGELGLLANLLPATIATLVTTVYEMPTEHCNSFARKMALELLDRLGPHLADEEAKICRSVAGSVSIGGSLDQPRLSRMEIRNLYVTLRNCARRAVAARALRCANVLPA
jgi:hypothetical protein